MICPMVPFPVTLSDPQRRFQGHGDALDELCAQLTRDPFAIAKFLLFNIYLDDLAKINSCVKRLFIVIYADDILLIAPSVTDLERLLSVKLN